MLRLSKPELFAWQNAAYNQPPRTSFFIGNGMSEPTIPAIKLTSTL